MVSHRKIECLRELVDSFQDTHDVLKTKGSHYILKMLLMELDYDEKIPNLNDVYLKVCGNNLRMTSYRLKDLDIPPMCAALIGVPVITMLDLRYNQLTDDGAITLGSFLKRDSTLKELNLHGNDIEVLGAEALSDGLKFNRTLLILKMGGNKIGSKGGVHLAHALQVNNTLQLLDVGECDMDITSCIALTTILRLNTGLTCLNVNRPLLFTHQEEPTVHVEKMLYINKTLKELHLAKYDMRDFGAERLSDALFRNRTLQVLDISCNRICRDGAIALSRALRVKCPLVVLDLAFNRIQCEGAKAIANAIQFDNTRLKVLSLVYNELKAPGLCALGNALFDNDSLRCIYIWGNEIDESVCNVFAHLLLIGRLLENGIDVRPYKSDDRTYLAMLNHDCDHRRWRFQVPWWKSQAPKDRSIALF